MKAAPYKAREDRREGEKYIAGLARTVKILWEKSCAFDGIDPKSRFVVFSDENKFAKFHQIALAQYLEACQQYEAGGYVGIALTK